MDEAFPGVYAPHSATNAPPGVRHAGFLPGRWQQVLLLFVTHMVPKHTSPMTREQFCTFATDLLKGASLLDHVYMRLLLCLHFWTVSFCSNALSIRTESSLHCVGISLAMYCTTTPPGPTHHLACQWIESVCAGVTAGVIGFVHLFDHNTEEEGFCCKLCHRSIHQCQLCVFLLGNTALFDVVTAAL